MPCARLHVPSRCAYALSGARVCECVPPAGRLPSSSASSSASARTSGVTQTRRVCVRTRRAPSATGKCSYTLVLAVCARARPHPRAPSVRGVGAPRRTGKAACVHALPLSVQGVRGVVPVCSPRTPYPRPCARQGVCVCAGALRWTIMCVCTRAIMRGVGTFVRVWAVPPPHTPARASTVESMPHTRDAQR